MQFSIRSLLATIAAIGIGAALWVAKPSWQVGAIEALLLAWVPASTIILASNSTGRPKAWWIGVAAECILTIIIFFAYWFSLRSHQYRLTDEEVDNIAKISTLSFFAANLSVDFRRILQAWAFAPVVGLLCVLTHWLLIRPPQGPQARGSTPEPKA